jgi:hypothetical protein
VTLDVQSRGRATWTPSELRPAMNCRAPCWVPSESVYAFSFSHNPYILAECGKIVVVEVVIAVEWRHDDDRRRVWRHRQQYSDLDLPCPRERPVLKTFAQMTKAPAGRDRGVFSTMKPGDQVLDEGASLSPAAVSPLFGHPIPQIGSESC